MISLIIGTRPQIIKAVPIIHESRKQGLDIDVIHTGQHYDYELSQVFLEEFSLPAPINLLVGSGSYTFQIAEIMRRLDKYLAEHKPSLMLISGDTNSALGGALTSVTAGIPVAHIEAGARCYDMKMAEEVNRRLIDHCSELLFAPTVNCKENLEKESVLGDVYLTGDVNYDIFLKFADRIDECDLDLPEEYALLTLHRAENVDDPRKLRSIIEGIQKTGIDVIFPVHPRTKNRLKEQNISLGKIKVIEPVDYISMLKLIKYARIVLTDSGGVQREAFWSKTPCIIFRDRTEWPETLDVNFLTSPDMTFKTINHVEEHNDEIRSRFKSMKGNPFGNGNASERIVSILKYLK